MADADGWVIVSGDSDFGELLARTNASAPSVILLRRQTGRRAAQIAALILANLAAVGDDLESGTVVVFDEDRIRVRTADAPGPKQPSSRGDESSDRCSAWG